MKSKGLKFLARTGMNLAQSIIQQNQNQNQSSTGGAVSAIGNMFGGSTRQKQTNDPFGASGSQAYDQATSLGAIQPDMIRDNFSSGMMMKSPLKELSSESLVSPFTMSPLEGNAFTKAMKDTGGNYEKAQEILKNE